MGHIRSRSRITLGTMGITGAIVLTFTAGARAQLLDDFNDGNDDGWTRATLPDPLPGAMWDASTFVYRLSAPGPNPPGSAVISILDITADPFFSNGLWWATVVRETNNSHSDLFMRGDQVNPNSYLYGWSPAGPGLFIGRVDFGILTVLANDPGFVQDVGVEYVLEAGAIGSDLELRMWLLGGERPVLPQLTATDSTYPLGINGVVAVSEFGENLSATYDDVSFVPEPATGSLAALAVLLAARPRRCR